ncbi:MAG: DUF58 domain-containing protein [Planktomarina sp.]|nr:DUF58 domain-containing protein [Planktomarina sp.]
MTGEKFMHAGLDLATGWPQLLAKAELLADSFVTGGHGRRRAGFGDTFWQFRPAREGDHLKEIDWRKTARSDDKFVREHEWQVAQSIQFWVDSSASMQFSSCGESKHVRAACLTLALAILLTNAGERVGTVDGKVSIKSGHQQVHKIAQLLTMDANTDFGIPEIDYFQPNSHVIFASDFFGEIKHIRKAVRVAAELQISGMLLMVLDAKEISFPYTGRTVFESMAGIIRYESQKADSLKSKYQAALLDRKSQLASLAESVGWQFHCHTTNSSPTDALIWLYQALEGRR